MKNVLTEKLKNLAALCPKPLYVVGGRVRDYLLGRECISPDTDICAPIPAEEFVKIAQSAGFAADAVYKNTGTVKISRGAESYEFSCFRSDKYVRGEHSPCRIYFTDDIALDARRRDFKCNAVYYDISGGKFCDPLGGIEDVKNGVLDTVAPPRKVFGEDGLRLMRLARIAAQTGFVPTRGVVEGARANANLICDISAERVFAELMLLLSADKKYGVKYAQGEGIRLLDEIGVLPLILPELCAGKGVKQRTDFHSYDVYGHSVRAAIYADERVRLAALLHDIGKPVCYERTGKFVGHEEVGAELAEGILNRFKAPKKLTERTVELIRLHMYDLRCDARESKARKFIVKNHALFDDLLLLKQADFSACKDCICVAPFVAKYTAIREKMKEEGAPFTLKELNVRGDELIAAGFEPQSVGSALNALLNDCACNIVKNEKGALLSYAIKVLLR